MQCVKGCRVDLARQEQVAQVGARRRAARVAMALRIEGAVILRITRVLNIDAPLAREELAVSGVPGRQDAVEKIDAPADRFDQIQRCPGTHQIAHAILWQKLYRM